MKPDLSRRVAAEALATAFLLAAVVGSGIMAERLAAGNGAIALLANAVATAGALVALIVTFGPISGAHLNPVVTMAIAFEKDLNWSDVIPYVIAQCVGGFVGVGCANIMFGLPVWFASQHERAGSAQIFSEFVATFGLLCVVLGCNRGNVRAAPFAIAGYITAAYWFTSSTSFANPAVTLARAASDTFAGIRPADTPGFIGAQLLGAAMATLLFHWLAPQFSTGNATSKSERSDRKQL